MTSEPLIHTRADWVRGIAQGGWRKTGLLFCLFVAFYLLTAAGNISETDDVYAFAYRAENFPVDYLSDPRLMLYHISMRLLFLASGLLGWDVSALVLMRGFSAVCAAASLLLLMRIVFVDLKLSAATAVVSAAVLGCSYGFWRYAAEAEVYVPAIFLILLVFHSLVRITSGTRDDVSGLFLSAGCGVISGITVLFYQPSVIPLFFAFPFLLLYRARLFHLGVYGVTGGAVVISGYLLGFFAFWPEPFSLAAFEAFLSQRSSEFIVPTFSLKTLVVSMIRSAFAIGHDLVSMNWVFAFDPVIALIQQAFSYHIIDEEVFSARRAGFLVYLPIVTVVALATVSLRILVVLGIPSITFLKQRPFLVIFLWTAINGAVVGRLNPGGLEAWIMVFPPLILLFAALVVEPCMRMGRGAWVVAFAVVLSLHNAVGGMALVRDPAHEYARVVGAWVIDEAKSEDLVIVTGDASLGESLRYLSAAQVAFVGEFQAPVISARLLDGDLSDLATRTKGRDFDGVPLHELIETTWRADGRVIFLERFFEVPRGFKRENWPEFELTSVLRAQLEQVHDNPDVGGTYLLSEPLQ
ncbi:hypothetical protein [Denitrobaculum tricleocarpae]|uniref:Glycosyltransferase RgtA/B/C/D-like domain-containing protein n=1 Tax=Denitrobaculum tricleocarpae TaxID=2591009 RepID=A0A545U1I9_9PROT|nr:hypothetical protein [Denitrobaculum tricleocarpae]TQV83340.1 hypothetical protein FKG95_01705 [Denitrobaculum tricleocarpae]